MKEDIFELRLTAYQEQELQFIRQEIELGMKLTDDKLSKYRYLSERQRKYRKQLMEHISN